MSYRDDLGDYMADISRLERLSPAETRDLATLANAAIDPRETQNRMVESNLGLVVRCAQKFKRPLIDTADLVAEGNLGLIRAAENYDPAFGTTFATHAERWIAQSMRRFIQEKTRVIRVTHASRERSKAWKVAGAAIEKATGLEPTPQEIGRALGYTPARIRSALDSIGAETLSIETIHATGTASEGRADFREPASPSDRESGVESVERADELRWVNARLPMLTEVEARVIKMRFGISPFLPMLFLDIALTIGISKGAVNTILREALSKLRGPATD